MISFVSASKISFDFLSSYSLLFWYLLFRYRWAHHLCFLSMNDLSRSSFFDLSIYLLFYFFFIFIQHASRRFPGSFSLIISPNSGFSFCYVSSMAFFLKRHFRRYVNDRHAKDRLATDIVKNSSNIIDRCGHSCDCCLTVFRGGARKIGGQHTPGSKLSLKDRLWADNILF